MAPRKKTSLPRPKRGVVSALPVFSAGAAPAPDDEAGGSASDTLDLLPKKKRRPKRVLSDWLVVRTKPNQERYAAKNIRRQGHRCVCPFITKENSNREQPLFAGHVFVQGPAWYYLKSTYGVLGPIMFGDTPAFMPIKQMRQLLKACGEDDVITVLNEKFERGQLIKVRGGAWSGWQGVFVRAAGKSRVRVLMAMLGGEHELEFNLDDITAAPPKKQGGSDVKD